MIVKTGVRIPGLTSYIWYIFLNVVINRKLAVSKFFNGYRQYLLNVIRQGLNKLTLVFIYLIKHPHKSILQNLLVNCFGIADNPAIYNICFALPDHFLIYTLAVPGTPFNVTAVSAIILPLNGYKYFFKPKTPCFQKKTGGLNSYHDSSAETLILIKLPLYIVNVI